MSKTDLFCLAYAPIQGTGLDNIESEEYIIENVKKEIEYLRKITNVGINCFSKFIDKQKCSSDNKNEDAAIMLYCLSTFFNRIQTLTGNAAKLAENSLTVGYPDITNAMKELMNVASSEGYVPSEKDLETYLDTSAGPDWETPIVAKGKVGFRQSISIINENQRESSLETRYVAPQQRQDVIRKKARQATGYAKFNFKDLEEEDNRRSLTDGSRTSSTTTRSTKLLDKNSTKLHKNTNKSSKSKKNSPSQNTSSPNNSYNLSPASKTNSNYSFIRSCWGLCGGAKSDDETLGSNGEYIRRESSVAVGNVEEIEDKDADQNWHDNNRRSERFARIRNRKPTGHPTLLAGTSDEMIDMLDSMNSDDAKEAKILLINTEKNI